MTSSDREKSLVLGVVLVAAGVGIVRLAVRQFKDPVGTTNAIADRLGGRHLPDWLRPRPELDPGYFRRSAVMRGIIGVIFFAVGAFAVASAFVW